MCPNKHFFKTFRSIEDGKMLLGNDLACKVAGIRTIGIKIFDGEIRNLDQVKYVSELKRNLISLCMFD